MKKLLFALLMLLLGGVTGAAATYWYLLHGMEHDQAEAVDADREILYYRNPMDSSITSPEPRQDHMGMDYIPVYADDNGDEKEPGTVRIRSAVLQNMNLRSATAERGELVRPVDAFGVVDYDEAGLSHVHMRTEGWVEELQVRTIGEQVEAGQLLFRLYSPTLVNAQEELLQSVRRGEGLEPARERLRALGMRSQDIREVERTGNVRHRVPVHAAHDGIVQELQIREGMFVTPVDSLMTIADLSRVWMLVDLFEKQSDGISIGQRAEVHLSSRPGESLQSRVDFIYPALATPTRTVRARLLLDNPDRALKPGMYARVRLDAETITDAVHVPAEAVIRTGRQSRVIVDRGEGNFQAREVRVGRRAGDRLEILKGLEDGERVVTSGQFLIDSESSVTAELGRLDEPTADEDEREISAEGVVNAIDVDAGTINLSHAPIPELDWPEMTMDFELADDLSLEGITPGAEVRFRMTRPEAGVYRVVAIEVPDDNGGPTADDAWAEAKVNRVNWENREMNISHGPIPDLDMAAMTMNFLVAEDVDLEQVEEGMRIRFRAGEAEPFGYEITAIEVLPDHDHGDHAHD